MKRGRYFQKWVLGGLLVVVVAAFLIYYIAGGVRERERLSYKTAEFYAMDTYFTVRVYGPLAKQALEDCEKEVRRLEALLSVTDEHSDVWRVNHEKNVAVAEETYGLVSDACFYGKMTGGALDITLYPVLQEWGFTTGEYRIPEEGRLQELLEAVDYRQVVLETQTDGETGLLQESQEAVGRQEQVREQKWAQRQDQVWNQEQYIVSVPENVQIDLGSVAKGYTGDALVEVLRREGVTSAILDLGGNVQTLGTKPDGSLWRVAVRNPYDKGSLLGVLEINDKCVITSGSYERYFTGEDGRDYWHILNPTDGYPADNGLVSVTVVGERGEECDALSTALFVMGKDKAVEFWKEQTGRKGQTGQTGLDFDMILVTEQGQLYVTQGLEDCFTCEEGWSAEIIFQDGHE